MEQEKKQYFNVLKGIAIFLVVVGHTTGGFIKNYCYSYHLALFFFISGLLFNEKKYSNNIALYIGNKFKNNYIKYILYTSLMGLLHFTKAYVMIGDRWSFYNYRNYILNNFVLNNTEALCGAMWFIPPFILASILLGIIVYIGNIVEKNTHISIAKHIVIVLLTIVCLLLGNERMVIKFTLGFRLDVALFVTPLLVIGYYVGTYIKNFTKYLKIYVAIPCFIITFYFCEIGFSNELVTQNVEIKLFYLLAIVGIYQSMYIANVICKFTKSISHIFSFLGRYTFEIMAFHFLVFKIVDIVCYIVRQDTDISVLSAFPYTYNVKWAHIIFGCALPAVCKWLLDRIVAKIKSNLIKV